MGGVIDFEARKLERSPHRSGKARCLNCKHEWIAVAPIGTVDLQCTKCETFQGVFVGISATAFKQWRCQCGEYMFFIDEISPYCVHCGERPNL